MTNEEVKKIEELQTTMNIDPIEILVEEGEVENVISNEN